MRTKNHPCIVTEPKPQGLGLPAIYRKAAERLWGGNAHLAGDAIWDVMDDPDGFVPVFNLWASFSHDCDYKLGDPVLGPLLLAEILETAG